MKRTLAAALSVALAGCSGYAEVHEVLLRQPSPPNGRGVEIYTEGQDPQRPFWEIAMLQAIGYAGDADMEGVAKALAGRAAELGCDALVRVHFDQGYGRAHGYGVCVRWANAR